MLLLTIGGLRRPSDATPRKAWSHQPWWLQGKQSLVNSFHHIFLIVTGCPHGDGREGRREGRVPRRPAARILRRAMMIRG